MSSSKLNTPEKAILLLVGRADKAFLVIIGSTCEHGHVSIHSRANVNVFGISRWTNRTGSLVRRWVKASSE